MNKISQLRKLFRENDISSYLVPSFDEFQSEYVNAETSRLKYLTGFSGSYGIAIITDRDAILFTDSRYILQAQGEIAEGVIVKNITELRNWCADNTEPIIGYDPNLFTPRQLEIFAKTKLRSIKGNLVDQIWGNRPPEKRSQPFVYQLKYAGSTIGERIAKLRSEIKKLGADYSISTDPACVCWLLGLRGQDQEHVMTFRSRMIVSESEIIVFSYVADAILKLVADQQVKSLELSQFEQYAHNLEGKIIIDAVSCSESIYNLLKNNTLQAKQDPIHLLKSCKTPVEIEGAKNAHIEDALSLYRFFAWLEEIVGQGVEITEYEAAERLSKFRSESQLYIADSFPAICGFEANGSIVHYRPNKTESKIIRNSSLILLDSGGHYLGGTTDITRTICLGTPTAEQKSYYTAVLKGNLALSMIKFPQRIRGSHLDVLARKYLWAGGGDYGHATGHGIGNVLSVHEGPQAISLFNEVPLQPGMLLSNEPGYYKDGSWGIRIEDVMCVTSSIYPHFLQFEVISLVPYAANLIIWEEITKQEMEYLKSYYSKIAQEILPKLEGRAKEWCERELQRVL